MHDSVLFVCELVRSLVYPLHLWDSIHIPALPSPLVPIKLADARFFQHTHH